MADPRIESLERMLAKGHISVDQYIQGLAALTPQGETPSAAKPAKSATQKTNARKRASRKRKALLSRPTEQPPAAPELPERVLEAPPRRGAKRVRVAPEPEPEPVETDTDDEIWEMFAPAHAEREDHAEPVARYYAAFHI